MAVPEKKIDMAAMRQVANLSASSALHKHESTQLTVSTRTKLMVTVVSLVVGVALLAISQFRGAPGMTLFGAAAAFCVATLWGINYLGLTSRLLGARVAHLKQKSKAGDGPSVIEPKAE